jgi:hypothetical protein
MVEASEFFREHISADDRNIMKFNCEGAETPILNNLIDTGEIWKISDAMIDFHGRVIPEIAHDEAVLIDRLRSIGFDRWMGPDEAYAYVNSAYSGTHCEAVAHWLSLIA